MMELSNRHLIPAWCRPGTLLPSIPPVADLFRRPPLLFSDFVARAIGFLQGDEARALGFAWDPSRVLPCSWRCADESTFGIDLTLFAFTGRYPFQKGVIGGRFNDASIGAAVHHGPINVDIGGPHFGFSDGGCGRVVRPLCRAESSDCGWATGMMEPYRACFAEAGATIMVGLSGGRPAVSVPNEYLHPDWSRGAVRLLLDAETVFAGPAVADPAGGLRELPGRTLLRLVPALEDRLGRALAGRLAAGPVPIGPELGLARFSLWDERTPLDQGGRPENRLLPYLPAILADASTPWQIGLAAAIAALEHNRLTDTIRAQHLQTYSFASFTGIFVDLYDEERDGYVNLFQPTALAVRPAGAGHEAEFGPDEIRRLLLAATPARPVLPLAGVFGFDPPARLVERFDWRP